MAEHHTNIARSNGRKYGGPPKRMPSKFDWRAQIETAAPNLVPTSNLTLRERQESLIKLINLAGYNYEQRMIEFKYWERRGCFEESADE